MARIPARRAWLIGAALALQLAVIVTLVLAPPASAPRDAPVALVAPPIVATALADEANALEDRPFVASIALDRVAAEQSLLSGEVVGAVIVDLATQRDTLLLTDATGPAANAAIKEAAAAIGAARGRTLDVEVLSVPGHHRGAPYALVLLCMVVGFAGAVLATVRRGPVEGSLRGGVIRIHRFVLLAMGCSVVAAPLGAAGSVAVLPVVALTFLLVLVAAMLTTALQSVLDIAGLAVATILFALTAAPLARGTHPIALPEPWVALTPWLPHGAGLAIARAVIVFGGTGSARDWALLGAYVGLAIVTVTAARQARARAGLAVPQLTAAPAGGAGRPS